MKLPRLSGKADPDNGETTAEWLQGDYPLLGPDQRDEKLARAQFDRDVALDRAGAAEQDRDEARAAEELALRENDVLRRDNRVLRDEVVRLTGLVLPSLPDGAGGEPVLPDVPEHDLTPVEVGSTPLDTPATDWDAYLADWDALPKRVPGEALAGLEAEER